jgi:protein-S-isoprenylcysteine O-methyltransferase Ste14
MADPFDPSDRRIERAIYPVGGLILFVLGLQSLSTTGLDFYHTLSTGSRPGPGSPFWVDNSVELVLGLLFVFAGLALLFLAWRTARRGPVR